METEHLISITEFCRHYDVEASFITSLQEYELIEITGADEAAFIHSEQLQRLEKLVRLHYDLDINLEGLDVIRHLLDRVEMMQQQMLELKNRIGRYEDG